MARALPLFQGGPGPRVAAHPDEWLANQLDPAALRAANVRLVIATVWPPPAMRPGRTAMDETLAQLSALRELPRRDSSFAIVADAASARRAIAGGLIALVPAVEGAEAIEQVEDVDTLFAAGVRSIGLVHFVDNSIADAENGQFGPLGAPFFDGKGYGLSVLGRAAVTRMFELGILVDVAHASPQTVSDVLAIAEQRRAPIISSHVGSGMAVARTLEDEDARRIAALGGLIGIGLYRHDTLKPIPLEDRWEGFAEGTCDEAIAHWTHLAKVAGREAIVLGSDLSSSIHRGRPGGSCPSGISSSAELPELFSALEKRGLMVSGAAERVLRMLSLLEQEANPDARASAARHRREPASPFVAPM